MQSAYRINNTQAVYEMAGKVSNNPSATVQQKATANFYLGKMAFDNRDYDAALSAFNKVVQINTGEEAAEARYLIANIAYLRRDLSAAENLANRAIQENSAFPYWVAKSMILLSDTYADMGDLFNARAVLEAIVENYDGDQTLLNEA
ncbi:MAG: tetratricopeptide repeat protein, partial [Saprospiraceae bacterium]|nr:tetratricopeptide repeat protein [Saprospiraceae bacterium]MCB0681925.1 tetratricopeptide repeat protein [Saprospiraceae bacterium]